MTALLYLLVAVMALGLCTQAWLVDREDPARQALLSLGGTLALAYTGFSLSLLPGLDGFRLLYMLAGCFVPAAVLWTVDRAFPAEPDEPGTLVPLVFVGAGVVAPIATLTHFAFYSHLRTSPPEVVASLLAFAAFGIALRRLWRAHEHTQLRTERIRLRYLFGVVATAVGFTVLEQLMRNVGAPVEPHTLSLSSRGVALQGPIPPVSAVFTGIAIYFLRWSVVMNRMLDLNELFSRIATLLTSAGLLLLIDGLTFLWVDTFTVYPFHSTFQLLLASIMFLAAYDPLRENITWLANRMFIPRGRQLVEAATALSRTLPSLTTQEDLAETLLDQLHATGRAPACAVYLWDARLDAFRCQSWRGEAESPPLKAVARRPFTERFTRGAPWYTRASVKRRAAHDRAQAEVLELLDAMYAHIAIPFQSGQVVLGWLALRDEPWTDGYTAEEIQRLHQLTKQGCVILSNIREFQAMEEAHRLAALGAMAAGLAHEIRNPLAGVKGAAQYLQTEPLEGASKEMLQVILDEASRLDVVVTQFLDYARPFELRLAPEHLNAVVTHTLTLLRAQGLPEGVTLETELSGELPRLELDAGRVSQVLLNLLQNAVQAMPDGGTLTVETRRRRDQLGHLLVEVEVADTGVGIEESALSNLFVPFFTTKSAGTGLGLAISQRIVTAHGGALDVRSTPGRGTSFVLRLPVTGGAWVEEGAEPAAAAS